ncbi:MAG TPA: lipid-binding SYLF domain-containing protein [Desulfobacterales bacterium]
MRAKERSATAWATWLVCFFVATGLLTSAVRADDFKAQQLVDASLASLNRFLTEVDYVQVHLQAAEGVLIAPAMYKGAFVLGGSGGRAILMVKDEATGDWIGPAFYTLGAGSIGVQIGVQKMEVLLMVMTRRGIESLYTSNFKLGGAVSVAAGPVGVGAEAATPLNLTADMISFTLAKGAFLGFSLEGTVVSVAERYNDAYYNGRNLRPADIFVKRELTAPEGTEDLRRRLRQVEDAADRPE